MDIISFLKKRLQQALPHQEALAQMYPNIRPMPKSIPDNALSSAVLILFYQDEGKWCFYVIRRSVDGHAHSGQIGFPGGRRENTDKDLWETAIREAEEEIGISQKLIEKIGALSTIYLPVSNFKVSPFIGFINTKHNTVANPDEVAQIISIPIEEFLRAQNKTETTVTRPNKPEDKISVNAYHLLDGTIIWGATAIILAELELLLKEVC